MNTEDDPESKRARLDINYERLQKVKKVLNFEEEVDIKLHSRNYLLYQDRMILPVQLQCYTQSSHKNSVQHAEVSIIQNLENVQCTMSPTVGEDSYIEIVSETPNAQVTEARNEELLKGSNFQASDAQHASVAVSPNVKFTKAPNVQFVDIPNIPIGEAANIKFAEAQNVQVTEGQNLQFFKASYFQASEAQRVPVSVVPNIKFAEAANVQVAKIPNIQIAKAPNIQFAEAKNVQVTKAQNVQLFKESNFKTSEEQHAPVAIDTNVKFSEASNVQVIDGLNFQAKAPNVLVSASPYVKFAKAPEDNFTGIPNIQNADAKIIKVVDAPNIQVIGVHNNTNIPEKLITRKKLLCPARWKKNIKKKLREGGKQYTDDKGNVHIAKTVKPACTNKCYLKCSENFTEVHRQNIKSCYYDMSDTKKWQYLSKVVIRKVPQRKRTKAEVSCKKNTFTYYFPKEDNERKQVCRLFFCNTLDITKDQIYYFHSKWQKNGTVIPPSPAKGKYIKKATDPLKILQVISHISSFPTEESHYCRAESKRKYLDRNLSISKMFSLYKQDIEEPVKENIYRKVFNEKFNISFYKPKKDVCDTCWEYKALKNPEESQIETYNTHMQRKEEGDQERLKDRAMNIDDEACEIAVLCYDLENVFSLPKANISSFFYKRKLSVYNLTAHCNINKNIYNALWDETASGRSGDDIASALIRILKQLAKDLPETVTKLILWSDSCVPQNKNSHMSAALIHFLKSEECGNISEIQQKFSEPGHGNIQEVDCAHSLIERHIRHQEIFSPLSLLRSLRKIKSNKVNFVLFQMIREDFRSYHKSAIKLSFHQVPYSKVKSIMYCKDHWNIVVYKLGFTAEDILVDINNKKINILSDVQVKEPPTNTKLNKIKDVQSMYKFMPKDDQDYYEAIFKKILKKQIITPNGNDIEEPGISGKPVITSAKTKNNIPSRGGETSSIKTKKETKKTNAAKHKRKL